MVTPVARTVGREPEVERGRCHEEYDPERGGGGQRSTVRDALVEQKRLSDGDVARHGDTDQTVGTDRLQAEVDRDDRRTEHPVTFTRTDGQID